VDLSFRSAYWCRGWIWPGLSHRHSQPMGAGGPMMEKIRLLLADDHPLVLQCAHVSYRTVHRVGTVGDGRASSLLGET
jgi:hypothetical protein